MKRKLKATAKPTASSKKSTSSELPTFLEHIYELRRRLFWVVAIILVASSAAYPFLNGIIGVLTAPLGSQQLYYLTPIGGLTFSFKLCMYVGLMSAVPFIMYHLYRYLEPLMGNWRKSAIFYVGLSSICAISGLLFAYYVSLPGALHFLTGLNIDHIQAMLTVDAYLTFVMTYLLGAALLFQIPLLLMIINTMTPLKPSKLMKIQRFVILGAFVLAAVISPTPDILNQGLFALPIIVMYQIGVFAVWIQNRARARKKRKTETQNKFVIKSPEQTPEPLVFAVEKHVVPARPAMSPMSTVLSSDFIAPARPVVPKQVAVLKPRPMAARSVSFDIMTAPITMRQPVRPTYKKVVMRAPQPIAPMPARTAISVPVRSIDGFTQYRAMST